MKAKYNFGIIGAGMIALDHIINLKKTNRANIKWLADIDKVKLMEYVTKFDIKNTTENYYDILADRDVDAIVICTPPNTHKDIFIAALNAGKHVLVEKPAAMNLSDIDEMIKISELHPELIALECSARHSRLQPKYQKIKEIINSGQLGDIYYIHHNSVAQQSRAGIEYHPNAKWFLDKKKSGGGPLFDWGVYDLSFHLGLLNDGANVKSINQAIIKSKLDSVDVGDHIFDVEEHFILNLRLDNGVAYYWERASHANMTASNETRIYGTKGGLKFGYCSWDAPGIEFFNVSENGKGKAQNQMITCADIENHDDAFALSNHYINVLDGKFKPELSLKTARKHLDIIFRCYKMAEKQ